MLHLKNVTKKFGAQTALNIPEWTLETGAYWIQGENGAGKSTLFHVIAGIFSFEGEIMLESRYSIRAHPVAYRSRVTFSETEPVYPSFLTPSDLLRYTAKMRKAHETQLLFSNPAYRFIYELRFLQVFARWKSWLAIAAGMLAPVWLYAVFIAGTGFKNGIPSAGVLIVCIVVLLLAAACLFLEQCLHTPLTAYALSRKANISRFPFKRPVSWVLWSLEWLVRERGLTLLLTKSATLFLLAGVLPLYEPERYDLRLPAFLFLVTGAIHAGLSQELFHWENSAYLNRRALPVPLIRRYMEAILVHAAVLLPEIMLSLRYGGKLFTRRSGCHFSFFLFPSLYFFTYPVISIHGLLKKAREACSQDL